MTKVKITCANARKTTVVFGFGFVQSGNPDGVWSHDKFQDAGLAGARRSGGLRTAAAGGGGGAKITINNLHFGVTDADIIVSGAFTILYTYLLSLRAGFFQT